MLFPDLSTGSHPQKLVFPRDLSMDYAAGIWVKPNTKWFKQGKRRCVNQQDQAAWDLRTKYPRLALLCW